MNRRAFLGTTTKAAAVAFGATTLARTGPARADAANDTIVVALIGCGSRGRDLGRMFAHRDDVVVKYLCDADLDRIGDYADQIARMQDHAPEVVQDMRRVLDDPEVNAVCIATTDHWHGLATVWACEAGKDVYVEKPASHNIWEGRQMIHATARYGRVVQVGMQNRSAEYVRAAREYIASGELGDVPFIKVFNLKSGSPFRAPRERAQPESVDYDLYLGPAPARPFSPAHFHPGWKKWWVYSGGDMADDGIHQLDIARYLVGDPVAPTAVQGLGGMLAFPEADGDVPDTQAVSFQFPGLLMTFDLTHFAPYMHKTSREERDTDIFPHWPTNSTRIELYGTRQKMVLGRHGGGWQAINASGEVVAHEYGRQTTMEHIDDFLECVRSRRTPNGSIEQGHHSAVLVHLGNTATALGGRTLSYDSAAETITNDDEANDFLLRKRHYREGFAIPEIG